MSSPELVSKVVELLPPTAEAEDGWTEEKIAQVMTANELTVAKTVRFYWLERVNETVQYINIGDKSLSALHSQAKAMLAYWDNIIAVDPNGIEASPGESSRQPIAFHKIKRPWERATR